MSVLVFSVVKPCRLIADTNVSEEHNAFTYRAQVLKVYNRFFLIRLLLALNTCGKAGVRYYQQTVTSRLQNDISFLNRS
jgi:hypothetical protein